MRRKRGLTIALFFCMILIAAAAAGYLILKNYINKSNYVSDDTFTVYYDIPEESGEEFRDESAEAAIEQEIDPMVVNQEIQKEDYVYNILLIGSDRRDGSWYGNADTIILVSVNTNVKKIFVTSFMRDLYAVIPGIGAKKLNAAYAHGAGPLLVRTIEENFKLDIDNWASVDFDSMESIVDLLGGVDLELYQEEADYLNENLPEEPVLSAGQMHLNGKQAVQFARIRYVGQYDFERTSRQRRVLEQLARKVRGLGLSQMERLAGSILPLITHNVPDLELVQKLACIPEWIEYEIVQERIPYDGLYTYLGEQIVPDYEETIRRLQEMIYKTADEESSLETGGEASLTFEE